MKHVIEMHAVTLKNDVHDMIFLKKISGTWNFWMYKRARLLSK